MILIRLLIQIKKSFVCILPRVFVVIWIMFVVELLTKK